MVIMSNARNHVVLMCLKLMEPMFVGGHSRLVVGLDAPVVMWPLQPGDQRSKRLAAWRM